MGEARDAFHMLVCMQKVVVTRVTQSMVPEETLRVCLDGVDRGVALDVLVEG